MAQRWQTGEDGFGLIYGALTVSFQRFAAPANGIVEGVPRSLGQLPLARERADRFVVPIGDGEAVWIGLSVPAGLSRRVAVVAQLVNGLTRQVCGPEAEVAPVRHLAGISDGEGRYMVLGSRDRGAARAIESLNVAPLSDQGVAEGDPAIVRFVSLSEARRLAPRLRIPPFDRDAGYQGVRLP